MEVRGGYLRDLGHVYGMGPPSPLLPYTFCSGDPIYTDQESLEQAIRWHPFPTVHVGVNGVPTGKDCSKLSRLLLLDDIRYTSTLG